MQITLPELKTGGIFFENEAQLQATINAVNAQNGEFVGYGVIDRDTIIQAECSEEACVNYVQFLRSSKAFNLDEIFIAKLYLAPKTLPPEWSEYVELIEGALEDECGGRCNAEYNPCWARELLLSKPKG